MASRPNLLIGKGPSVLSEYPPDLPLQGWADASADNPASLRPYFELLCEIEANEEAFCRDAQLRQTMSNLDLERSRLVSAVRPSLQLDEKHLECVHVLSLMLLDRFREFKYGSTRIAFISSDSVYKLAFCEDGAIANRIEVQGVHCGVPIAAACWTVVAGVALLRMEKVEVVRDKDHHKIDLEKYPWVPLVDMKQVGWTKTGDLVCYDAGQMGNLNKDLFRPIDGL